MVTNSLENPENKVETIETVRAKITKRLEIQGGSKDARPVNVLYREDWYKAGTDLEKENVELRYAVCVQSEPETALDTLRYAKGLTKSDKLDSDINKGADSVEKWGMRVQVLKDDLTEKGIKE